MTTINVRTIDPNVLTDEKMNSYVTQLHEIVNGHDFEGHIVVKHGKDCPSEEEDIFKHPDSQRYSDMIEATKDMPSSFFDQFDSESDMNEIYTEYAKYLQEMQNNNKRILENTGDSEGEQ